jgi:hypothetical protein
MPNGLTTYLTIFYNVAFFATVTPLIVEGYPILNIPEILRGKTSNT